MMSKATPTHRATADAMFSRCVSLPSQPPSLSSGGAPGPTLMSRRRDRIPVRYAVKMIRRLSAKAIQDSARRTVTFGSSGATLFTKTIETPSAPDESVRMALVEVSGGRVVGLPQPGVPIVFRNHPAPPKRTLAPTGDNLWRTIRMASAPCWPLTEGRRGGMPWVALGRPVLPSKRLNTASDQHQHRVPAGPDLVGRGGLEPPTDGL